MLIYTVEGVCQPYTKYNTTLTEAFILVLALYRIGKGRYFAALPLVCCLTSLASLLEIHRMVEC